MVEPKNKKVPISRHFLKNGESGIRTQQKVAIDGFVEPFLK